MGTLEARTETVCERVEASIARLERRMAERDAKAAGREGELATAVLGLGIVALEFLR